MANTRFQTGQPLGIPTLAFRIVVGRVFFCQIVVGSFGEAMRMMHRLARWIPLGVAVILLVTPMAAQRPVAAKFDTNKRTTLKGIVTRVDWSNPHVHILMNVPDAAKPISWAVELESQLELERSAWNRDSLKPGDAITVQGPVARDGSKQIWGDSVVLGHDRTPRIRDDARSAGILQTCSAARTHPPSDATMAGRQTAAWSNSR